MSWLIKALVALFVLLAMLLLPGTPDGPMLSAAASVGDELDTLIAALPETTLAAVELRGVSRRWKEIKEIPALLSAFDRLLADAGLTADDLPGLVGDAAVVAWVPGDRPGSVAPVLLLPVDRPQPVVGSLASVRARGALFVSRQQDAELLPRVSRGDGTSMIDRLPEIRLGQAGGDRALVHGRIDPQAVRELLRQRPSGTEPWIVTAALSMIDAELATVRGAEFRRDLRAGALVTEAIVRLDGRGLPAQVAAVFDSARPAAPLPHPLPADVVLASSFDPQPQACLAWMRHVARRDPRGPWRNLEFWIDELEQQAGFDLEDDLLRSLGDRGWLFVFESGAVLILEARNPELVEQALLAAREVFKEHTIGRTLGFTIPRDDDRRLGSSGHTASSSGRRSARCPDRRS